MKFKKKSNKIWRYANDCIYLQNNIKTYTYFEIKYVVIIIPKSIFTLRI